MKSLLLSFIVSVMLSTSSSPTTDTVYICNGPQSTRYHLKENCSGLNRCSTEVQKVTIKQAKDKGRTLCKLED